MTAAPFKAVLKWRAANGETWSSYCTVSDVDGEYYTFADGSSDVVLPSNKGNIALVDVILSAAGTDTTKADIYANARATGETIMNALNITTVIGRQFVGSPIVFAPSTRVKLKQLS